MQATASTINGIVQNLFFMSFPPNSGMQPRTARTTEANVGLMIREESRVTAASR